MFYYLPTLTSIFGGIYISYQSYYLNTPFFLWSLLNSWLSFYYHLTEERCCIRSDVSVSGASLTYIFWESYKKNVKIDPITNLFLILAFFYLGRSWGNCRPRRAGYTFNHSFFHTLASLGLGRMIKMIS
jgi:hypothetical protein